MHQKHGIDRGTEVAEGSGAWRGYPSGSGVPPPPEKLQRTSAQLYCPRFPGFGSASFQSVVSTARRPIQLQSATRRPDCAWTVAVGIASVGTESVGIVWCPARRSLSYSMADWGCPSPAPRFQSCVNTDTAWPHNALRHHYFICHFRECKAILV